MVEEKGSQGLACVVDVRDPEMIQSAVNKTVETFGGIDILVHNAAVRNNTSFEDMELETFSTTVDISIYGMFHLAKAVLPSMKERGGGAIIGVGGMTSTRGAATRSHTMAAKMGLNALIRGLALDLAPYGIRANQVVVGTYDTVRENNPSSAPTAPLGLKGKDIPLGRMGMPQDMADLIRFVVGPGASYITGQTIHSNGGAFLNL